MLMGISNSKNPAEEIMTVKKKENLKCLIHGGNFCLFQVTKTNNSMN